MTETIFLGNILRDNPKFLETQGFKIKENPEYYGCIRAEVNHHPVYIKNRYINYDWEEEAAVELFSCDYGVVQISWMVFLFQWNNAGGSRYPMIAAKQISTLNQYNEFIKEYGLDKLEDEETFLISIK